MNEYMNKVKHSELRVRDKEGEYQRVNKIIKINHGKKPRRKTYWIAHISSILASSPPSPVSVYFHDYDL